MVTGISKALFAYAVLSAVATPALAAGQEELIQTYSGLLAIGMTAELNCPGVSMSKQFFEWFEKENGIKGEILKIAVLRTVDYTLPEIEKGLVKDGAKKWCVDIVNNLGPKIQGKSPLNVDYMK
jgi:hypothetical protein